MTGKTLKRGKEVKEYLDIPALLQSLKLHKQLAVAPPTLEDYEIPKSWQYNPWGRTITGWPMGKLEVGEAVLGQQKSRKVLNIYNVNQNMFVVYIHKYNYKNSVILIPDITVTQNVN